MNFCPNCGRKVEKTNFCSYCGYDLKKYEQSILPSTRKSNIASDQGKEMAKSFGKFILAKATSSIKDYSEKVHAGDKTNFSLNIHPDLRNLLWFGDGPKRNYIKEKKQNESIRINGYTIYFSTYGSDEPSLILTKLPIAKPVNISNVSRPPYYPTYVDLTPEQRWMYWQFLENPYSGSHDIGYVFIFYYGLERYLFSQNSENAVSVILKLRDCYTNTSFQSYSSTAIILYAISKKDTALATSFLNSLDKSHEMKIPADLLILLKYTLGLPLTAYEIMRYSKAFLFSNHRYIKNNPDVFLGFLQQEITAQYGSDFVQLGLFFDNADVTKIPAADIPLFANISIRDKIVRIPRLCEYAPFTAEMNNLLTVAHESTKKYLAEQRKTTKKNGTDNVCIKKI